MDRDPAGSEVQGVRASGMNQGGTDPLPTLIRRDEDTLQVRRMTTGVSWPRHTWDEGKPCHADDLAPVASSDEGNVGVVAAGPPRGEVDGEVLDGLVGLLGGCSMQPEQSSEVRDVVMVRDPNVHAHKCFVREPEK